MHDLSNEISFKFQEFEHLKLKNIKTNFTKINFEDWKFFENKDGDLNCFVDEDSSKLTVEKYADFGGLKLEKKNTSKYSEKIDDDDSLRQIVFVETTKKNLNKIVMSIISDYCIVVEGDLSTGKTMLVEYLSKRTNKIAYQ